MRVVIRAFSKDGYHRDIAMFSEQQVHMADTRFHEELLSTSSGLIGVGVGLDPSLFPEAVRFEVVIPVRQN